MKAWLLDGPEALRLEEFAPTTLSNGMVKVKVEKVLLSTSDYEIYNGTNRRKYPFVFGRNAMGVVSEVFNKEKSKLRKMDRVVIEPYLPCESCAECLAGDYTNCSEMAELGHNCNGLLQNFVDLPYSALHVLPDNLSDEKALFVSYLAFCLNIADSLNLEKGRHIAVFATSKAGLLLAQLVAFYQAVPVLVSNNEELLASAQELGIYYSFNSDQVDVEKEIRTITGGRMCKELVFFANSDYNFKDVFKAASVNANICVAGYSAKESKLSVAQICQKHLKIFGVYNGVGKFSSAINLLVTNTINIDKLVGKTIKFSKLDQELAKSTPEEFAISSKIVVVE